MQRVKTWAFLSKIQYPSVSGLRIKTITASTPGYRPKITEALGSHKNRYG